MSVVTYREDEASDQPVGDLPLTLRLNESFEEFVTLNPDLVVEQNANGEIVIMSPTGGESSERNAELTFQLRAWSKQFGGVTFDSSVIFCLPDGSKRSPDASWISSERWLALPLEDRKKYPPITPDFVIELRSESDRLKDLQEKMQYYMDNGVRLGWLIDRLTNRVHMYQQGIPVEILESPESVSNQELLPEFTLDLMPIWKK
jgi:Uma2 family endonuclease